jgi:RNA polymerase sigma-70 factor (ECF subfamily)
VIPDDHELIAASRAGQTQAFGQLVQRYQDRLFNTLVATLGSLEDARDVAQETFILAFQKLHTFREQSAFYSWLYRIALNTAASQRRKKTRETVSLDGFREATGVEPADSHPELQPSFSLEQAERQRRVRQALSELPNEYRTALVLSEVDGMKYEEIAEQMGCPVGTVRSRIHRARLELKQKLQGMMGAPDDDEE